MKITDLFELLEPKVSGLGYKCKDITFNKNGKDWVLTVFIDNDEPISLDDCEKVSRVLSDYLDETDPIEQSYILEVSSPGIDAPLITDEDFSNNIDQLVEVNLYKKFNNKKKFVGTLKSFDNDSFTIEEEDNEITFNKNEVSKVAPYIEI